MNNASQVVTLMLEDQRFVKAVSEYSTAAAQAFAQQTGMTFNPANQRGSMRTGVGMSSEDEKLLATVPAQWEFTDARGNSETPGMSFYVAAGTPLPVILQRYEQKKAEWIEMERAAGVKRQNAR